MRLISSQLVLILLRDSDSEFTWKLDHRLGYNNRPLPPTYNSAGHIYIKVVASFRTMNIADITACDISLVLYSYHVFRPWLLEQFDNAKLSCRMRRLDNIGPMDLEEELGLLGTQRECLHSLRISLNNRMFIDSRSSRSQTPPVVGKMYGIISDVGIL